MAPNIYTNEPEDSYKVWVFKELVRQKNSNEARAILKRVTKQVQPLMKRRQWRVKLVREFYPKNPSLLGLNVNRGVEVKVRLRQPGDPERFFPYEHILGTMLHELCHNVIGPHNAAFYKLLDEITEEVERDMANGNFGTGSGFDGRSSGRLGGRGPVPVHNPNPVQLRQKILQAAEGRLKKQKIMSSGPQRLGGSSNFARGLTPSQAAAKAAERRMRDDQWCPIEGLAVDFGDVDIADVDKPGSSSTPADKARGTKCTDGCCSVVIDLTADESEVVKTAAAAVAVDEDEKRREETGEQTLKDASGIWVCLVCTLHNKQECLLCAACGSSNPSRKSSKKWTCKFCTLSNAEADSHCKACSQWRFSHGAPVSSNVKWNQT